jgi:hypothetical protein
VQDEALLGGPWELDEGSREGPWEQGEALLAELWEGRWGLSGQGEGQKEAP